MAHILEIVTPPANVLQGFVLDQPGVGRSVFVHLPPSHLASSSRPEVLEAPFSEVLRPHDPTQRQSESKGSAPLQHLEIRESLTALLDLASDSLIANSLILVLDKIEGQAEIMAELLHSLLYAGGHMIQPGALHGWDWDNRAWVLVGMEL